MEAAAHTVPGPVGDNSKLPAEPIATYIVISTAKLLHPQQTRSHQTMSSYQNQLMGGKRRYKQPMIAWQGKYRNRLSRSITIQHQRSENNSQRDIDMEQKLENWSQTYSNKNADKDSTKCIANRI